MAMPLRRRTRRMSMSHRWRAGQLATAPLVVRSRVLRTHSSTLRRMAYGEGDSRAGSHGVRSVQLERLVNLLRQRTVAARVARTPIARRRIGFVTNEVDGTWPDGNGHRAAGLHLNSNSGSLRCHVARRVTAPRSAAAFTAETAESCLFFERRREHGDGTESPRTDERVV